MPHVEGVNNDHPEPWHLLDDKSEVLCGRERDRTNAATRYDARGLRETVAFIRAVGGATCPNCTRRAKRVP